MTDFDLRILHGRKKLSADFFSLGSFKKRNFFVRTDYRLTKLLTMTSMNIIAWSVHKTVLIWCIISTNSNTNCNRIEICCYFCVAGENIFNTPNITSVLFIIAFV